MLILTYDEKDDNYKMIDFENDDKPTLYYTIKFTKFHVKNVKIKANLMLKTPKIQRIP